MKNILLVIIMGVFLSACNLSTVTTATRTAPPVVVSIKKTSTATPDAKPQKTATINFPTVTPQKMAKVIVDNTILRAGPGVNYPVLETLFKGEPVSLLGRNQDASWLNVLSSIGNRGWVYMRNTKSLADIGSLLISEEVISTPTISPTPTRTVTIAPRQNTPTNTPTVISSSTPSPTIQPSPTDDVIFVVYALVDKYEDYLAVFDSLRKSKYTGEAVKNAYQASMKIIDEIYYIEVPDSMAELKANLREGIRLQATGVGCYSNETLWSGDLEATAFLAKGRILLDKFRNEVHTKYNR